MQANRWTLWTVALLVVVAAAVKAASADRFASDLSALVVDAGLPPWPAAVAPLAAWTLIASEAALAVAIVVPRSSRAGLASLLGIVAAGVVLVGLASDWGRRAESVCPCGVPFLAPFAHSGFAMLLLRDACIVLLVALAWPAGTSKSPRPGTVTA